MNEVDGDIFQLCGLVLSNFSSCSGLPNVLGIIRDLKGVWTPDQLGKRALCYRINFDAVCSGTPHSRLDVLSFWILERLVFVKSVRHEVIQCAIWKSHSHAVAVARGCANMGSSVIQLFHCAVVQCM